MPPAAISDWRYLAVSLLAGTLTFWQPFAIDRVRSPVLLFDAAGLGLFAVAGTFPSDWGIGDALKRIAAHQNECIFEGRPTRKAMAATSGSCAHAPVAIEIRIR